MSLRMIIRDWLMNWCALPWVRPAFPLWHCLVTCNSLGRVEALWSFFLSTWACLLLLSLLYLCLGSHAVLTSHLGNLSLQLEENTAENHNQSKYIIMKHSPEGYIYNTIPHLRLKDHCFKGAWKDCRNQRGLWSLS